MQNPTNCLPVSEKSTIMALEIWRSKQALICIAVGLAMVLKSALWLFYSDAVLEIYVRILWAAIALDFIFMKDTARLQEMIYSFFWEVGWINWPSRFRDLKPTDSVRDALGRVNVIRKLRTVCTMLSSIIINL